MILNRVGGALRNFADAVEVPAGWVRYHNALEKKLTCRNPDWMPASVTSLLLKLMSFDFTSKIRDITGINELVADPMLHGAGVHCMLPGDHLEPHIDFAVHPKARFLERRVNLVLCLSPSTFNGGQLQLWNEDATRIEVEIWPKFNSAVVWEASDVAFHSVAPVTSDEVRSTLAVYYCTPATGCHNRLRALYAPRR